MAIAKNIGFSNGDSRNARGSSLGVALRPEAARALDRLNDAFKQRFGRDIRALEGMRSIAMQQHYWDLYRAGKGNLAAVPGTSNHGWGVAIDFGSPLDNRYSDEHVWMRATAAAYGWWWAGGTFGQIEPWHWEYQGGGHLESIERPGGLEETHGIDISFHQAGLPYDAVLSGDVDFVILKAGGSNTGSAYTDSQYANHATGIRNRVPVGSYWMNGAGDPVKDAEHFLANLRDDADDVVVLDIETIDGYTAWTPTQALAWINRVRQSYSGPVYAYMNTALAGVHDWTPLQKAGVLLWLANYGADNGTLSNANPGTGSWSAWSIHQYTQKGTMPGWARGLDLNRAKPGVFNHEEGELSMADVQQIVNAINDLKNKKNIRLIRDVSNGKVFAINEASGSYMHVESPRDLAAMAQLGIVPDPNVKGNITDMHPQNAAWTLKLYTDLGPAPKLAS